jgi:hypothetical protein
MMVLTCLDGAELAQCRAARVPHPNVYSLLDSPGSACPLGQNLGELSTSVLSFDDVANHHEQENTLDFLNGGMVQHGHCSHKFKLRGVCVSAGLAGLVIGYAGCLAGLADCEVVWDTPEPYILVKKATRAKVNSDRHTVLAPDFSVVCGKWFDEVREVCELWG